MTAAPRPRLVLRADAGGLRGSGHVMRCLALAEAWIGRGGEAALVAAGLPSGLAARARAIGVVCNEISASPGAPEDAAALRAFAAAAAGLVVDGYHFDVAYLDAVAGAAPLLVVDDVAALVRYPAALLLNQNIHADAALYAGRTRAKLLLGPDFALLRGEFRKVLPTLDRAGLFATFGGVDPHRASEAFLAAAHDLPQGVGASLAIGGANPRADEIARTAVALGVAIVRDVTDMAARLARAKLVVTAGGSTLWEGCAAGAPMLVLSVVAEEHVSATALAARGACRYLGRLADIAPPAIAAAVAQALGDAPGLHAIGAAARTLVDGFGADRVVDALLATPR